MNSSIFGSPSRIAGGLPWFLCVAAIVATMIVPSFTPVTAAPIVIDDFTYNQGTFSNTSSLPGDRVLFNNSAVGSWGGFFRRGLASAYDVGSDNAVVFSGSASAVGNGSLTLRHAKGGFPVITGSNPISQTVLSYDMNGVGTAATDLTDGGSNNTLRFSFSGVAISGLAPVASVRVEKPGFIGVYSGTLLPTTTVGATTVDIPFSSFSDSSVFSQARQLNFSFENLVFGGAARSAEYTLTGISSVYVVPEPTTYAMALAGLACGGYSMWRRRKRA